MKMPQPFEGLIEVHKLIDYVGVYIVQSLFFSLVELSQLCIFLVVLSDLEPNPLDLLYRKFLVLNLFC